MSKKCTPLWREAHVEVKMHIAQHARTTWEVEMSKKCTPLWREARFEVKSVKNWRVRSTFGRSDAVLRGRRQGFRMLSKWIKRWGALLPFQQQTLHYRTLNSTTLHYNYTTLRYNNCITLHYATQTTTITTTTLHYTTLCYTTLHSTSLHFTTLNYTTLHYSFNNNYTTLHHTNVLHFTTRHSITLHYTTLPKQQLQLHYCTLHYTNYITLHSLHHHKCNCNATTPQLQLHYTTTTAALHHTSGWGDRPGDHCNHCNHSKNTTPTTFQSISGFALPSMHHNNSPLLACPIFKTSATALCGTTGIYTVMCASYKAISQYRGDPIWYMGGFSSPIIPKKSSRRHGAVCGVAQSCV